VPIPRPFIGVRPIIDVSTERPTTVEKFEFVDPSVGPLEFELVDPPDKRDLANLLGALREAGERHGIGARHTHGYMA